MSIEVEVKIRSVRDLVRFIAFALVAIALAQELRKPASERTWYGRLWDLVPYDFRPPSWERIRRAFWDPDNPSLFTPTPLGVGWQINLAALCRRLSELLGERPPRTTSPPLPEIGRLQEELGE